MATMAQKWRKQAVKETKGLIKQWLAIKKNTQPNGTWNHGGKLCYFWNVPGLTADDRPVAISEKGRICVEVVATRYNTFTGKVYSRKVESWSFAPGDSTISNQMLEKILQALRSDTGITNS